ncbi:MAG: 50S ribosomal protein L16 [Planctomycetota bacterium]
MPLMPKRILHRKIQRGQIKGKAARGNTVAYGDFGLQALEPGWITARQIEAGRVSIAHFLAREGRLWVRVFPHKAITARPAESRMGKGKGEPEQWVAAVKPGTVVFEVGGVPEDLAVQALNRAAHKFPLRMKMIHRRHGW